jgi:hypothetical protein
MSDELQVGHRYRDLANEWSFVVRGFEGGQVIYKILSTDEFQMEPRSQVEEHLGGSIIHKKKHD